MKIHLTFLVSLFLLFGCNNKTNRPTNSNFVDKPENNVIPEIEEELLDDINRKLVYSNIVEVDNFLEKGDGASGTKSFVITLKEEYIKDITNFEVYEYSKETGGSYARLPFKKIFNRVDSVYSRKENFAEALKQIEIGTDYKILKIKSSLAPLIEAYYILRILTEKRFRKIDIFIRGYADKKLINWSRGLTKKYSDSTYQKFLIHRSVSPDSENEFLFYPKTSFIQIGALLHG